MKGEVGTIDVRSWPIPILVGRLGWRGHLPIGGAFQNRPDDNSEKDFNYRMLVRPTWKNATWGSAELGMSSQFGRHGETGGVNPIFNPINGLNRQRTWALLYKTTVITGGINYYIRGHFAKIQLNYNAVRYPTAGTQAGFQFHQTNSNSLVCNFQVAF